MLIKRINIILQRKINIIYFFIIVYIFYKLVIFINNIYQYNFQNKSNLYINKIIK